MTPDSEMVPVVQSDRDAAAAYHHACRDRFTAHITDGLEDDTAIVQAFARYRATIAAEADAAAIERATGVALKFAAFVAENKNHPKPLEIDTNEGWRRVEDAAIDIAESIRASQPAAKGDA